jgi:hypothetical protein
MNPWIRSFNTADLFNVYVRLGRAHNLPETFFGVNGTGSPLQEQAVLGQIQMKLVEFV